LSHIPTIQIIFLRNQTKPKIKYQNDRQITDDDYTEGEEQKNNDFEDDEEEEYTEEEETEKNEQKKEQKLDYNDLEDEAEL
jgi:hypothetical protein